MANIIMILGIALLLAGAALVVTGSSQVGEYMAWDYAFRHSTFSGGMLRTPYGMLDWLPIAMPLAPGALLIAWASRLKHKNLSQNGSK